MKNRGLHMLISFAFVAAIVLSGCAAVQFAQRSESTAANYGRLACLESPCAFRSNGVSAVRDDVSALRNDGFVFDAAAPYGDDARFQVEFHTRVGTFHYTDEEIDAPNHLIADEIAVRKINAPLTEKRAIMSRAVKSGATYERAVTICMPRIKNVVDSAEEKLFVAAVDATLTFHKQGSPAFTVTREREGSRLDREKTFQLIYAAVQRYKGVKTSLALPLMKVEPSVRAESLIQQTYVKAEFNTQFNTDYVERADNIALALEKINGYALLPGAEFSFNETVGTRSAANGFKEAKIILDGEYVLGFGGGVCQASTTLYNAALRAGMEVTMVRNHSLSCSYVPPSLDAMVNSGSSDLRFKNPLQTPVYVRAWVQDGRACIRIYGEKNRYRIVPVSRVLETIKAPADRQLVDTEYKYLPKEALPGETMRVSYGKDGVKSEAYLEYYEEQRLVRRVKIRSDVYRTAQGVVAVAP